MATVVWRDEDMPEGQYRISDGGLPLVLPANPLRRVFVRREKRPIYVENTGSSNPDENPTLRAPTLLRAPAIIGTAQQGQTVVFDLGEADENPSSTISVRLLSSLTDTSLDREDVGFSGTSALLVASHLSRPWWRLEVTRNNGLGTLVSTSAPFGPIVSGTVVTPPLVAPTAVPSGIPAAAYEEDTGDKTINVAGGFFGESLTYSLVSPPAGVTITGSTVTVSTTNPIAATTVVVRATNTAGSVDNTFALSVAAAVIGTYLIPDNKWTSAQNFSAELGKRDVFVEADQPIPTGYELVWYGGTVAAGVADQTRVIVPGVRTISNGVLAVGQTVHSRLYWRSGSPGSYSYVPAAVSTKVFTIVTPTVVPQLSAASWTLTPSASQNGRAEIYVAPANIITWTSSLTTGQEGGSFYGRLDGDDLISFDPWVQVMLPDDYATSGAKRYPVIIYLNGSGAALRTPFVFASLQSADAIVVSIACHSSNITTTPPPGGNGWYVNSPVTGNDWADYILDRLIPWIDATYRTNGPNQRAIMGNSMGAYGAALMVGLRPDAFGAAAFLSGGVSDYTHPTYNGGYMATPLGAYDPVVWQPWEAVPKLAAAKTAGKLPYFFVSVGPASVDVYDAVQRFRTALTGAGIVLNTDYSYNYLSDPSNEHSFIAPRNGSAWCVPIILSRLAQRPANPPVSPTIEPAGYTLRASYGTTIPTTPADGNTEPITPGVTRLMTTDVPDGQTARAALWWKRTSDSAYLSAADPKSFVVPVGPSNVTQVSSVTALYNAIISQSSGAIEVAPGNYGALPKIIGANKPLGLVIRPQDRANPPVFTGDSAFFLQGCSGLTFDGLTFAPTSRNARGFHVGDGVSGMIECQWWTSNITIVNCTFNAANFNVVLRRASNCRVAWNTFFDSPQDFIRIFEDNNGHIIENNRFGPHVWDFLNYPNAHADAIQGAVTGTNTAPKNIIIRKNQILQTVKGTETVYTDWGAHGIFLGNNRMVGGFGSTALGAAVYSTPGAYYENWTIEDNYIEGTHANGIGVQGIIGITARRNVLRRKAGTPDTSDTYCPAFNAYFAGTSQAIRNAVVTDNVFPGTRIMTTDGINNGVYGVNSNFSNNFFSNNTGFPVEWPGMPLCGAYGWNAGVPDDWAGE